MSWDLTPDRREKVGVWFSLSGMQHARAQSVTAVERIAAAIHAGMTTLQACDRAAEVLAQMGMERSWHRPIVCFGEDTLKKFSELADPERVLQDKDIFFVDIGPVWEGHEGDAGDTFVIGDDAEMKACADAARALWHEVAARWRGTGSSGQALYAYAAERAESMGWRFDHEIKGHRVSDFPHAIYKAGKLGDFGLRPATGIWVLEIQIAHPTRPFGAFYEDLLIEDGRAATEWLFSYGTLQLEPVQLATFGRRLEGRADALPGYRLDQVEIRDAAVVATSGKTHHPMAVHTGRDGDRIEGAVFAITATELAHADAYEVDDYRRERVALASGEAAWAYVDARVPAATS